MRVDNMIVRAHDQEDTSRNRTLVGLGPVDAKSALSAKHTASRKAGFTRAESK
jgi:hypothetical protein